MAYISTILEQFLGTSRKHNESTGQISFDCPACSMDKGMPDGDGKGNLEINYNEDVFKCWACKDVNSMSGSIIKLIKKYGNSKALNEYKLFKPEVFKKVKDKQTVVSLPEGFKLLKDSSSKDYMYDVAMNYLKKRGITSDIIQKFDIGYTTKGEFFNRIIIPSYDENGIINYFIARWFGKKYNKLKYLNPDAEKQDIIFNEQKINWDATIYLVEGVTDHIVIPNSIPLLGKYISDILLEKLYDKAGANIVIVLDEDAIADAILLYRKLDFGKLKGRIRLCHPPKYDPSKINELLGKKGIIKLLKRARKLKVWE